MRYADMFLPYQVAWITDPSPMKIMAKSRRVGVSWCSAYSLVDQAILRPAIDLNVYSRDEELAGDMISYIRPWLKAANVLADEEYIRTQNIRAYGVNFANGSRIRAWSSAPDRGVGKSGISLLDEFQSHQNAEKLYSYIAPTRLWGGSVWIVGTCRGSTLFWQIVEDAMGANKDNWSLHKITLDDALSQGLLKKVNSTRRAKYWPEYPNEEAFKRDLFQGLSDVEIQQEFYVTPVEKVTRVFGDSVIERQMLDTATMFKTPNLKKGLSYLGFDVGAVRDRTCICVIEYDGGKFFVRNLKTLEQGTEFSEMFRELESAVTAWTPEKIVIDATTIGLSVAELAMRKWGNMVAPENSRVIQATLSGMAREKIIVNCQSLLEGGKLFIPRTEDMRRQFTSVTKKITPEGWVRYVVPRTASGHCDEMMAVALACYGVTNSPFDVQAQRLQKPPPGKQKWGKDPHRHPEEATAY